MNSPFKQINILYHHRTQGRGVEGVHIREMVKAWKKQGHNVEMIEPPGVSAFGDNSRGDKSNGIVKTIYPYISKYVPEIIFEMFEITYNFSASKRLRRILVDKQFDFLYERYALFNWSGVREALKTKTPIVLEVNYTSQTPLYRKRSKILKPIAGIIEQWLFKNADRIVVVSTYLKEYLLKLSIDREKIMVLTNAADPEKFLPMKTSLEIINRYGLNEKTIIGFAGGFYPWHGLDLLLNAFNILSKKYSDIVLLLVGDGPMALEFKKDSIDLGLENKIVFTGSVKHEDLSRYISSFDIAVMPHSNEYGSPMKIYEYMAMGKPVVAPRFSPLMDGISHGVEGFLFEPGNLGEITFFLEKLINDKALRMKMGNRGRERIITCHNWQNNALSVIRAFISHTSLPYHCKG